MNGESWQNAVQRAGSQIRYESQLGGSPRDTVGIHGNEDGTEKTNMCYVGRKTNKCRVSVGKDLGGTQRAYQDMRRQPQNVGPMRRSEKAFKDNRIAQGIKKGSLGHDLEEYQERNEPIGLHALHQGYGGSPRYSPRSYTGGSPRYSPRSYTGGSPKGKSTRANETRASRAEARFALAEEEARKRAPAAGQGARKAPAAKAVKATKAAKVAKVAKVAKPRGRPKGPGHSPTTNLCYYNTDTDRCNETKLKQHYDDHGVHGVVRGSSHRGGRNYMRGGGDNFSDTSSTRSSDFTSVSDTSSFTGGSSLTSDTSFTSNDSSSIW